MNWREKILKTVDEIQDEIVEFLRDLIRIPTENPPGKNYPEIAGLIGEKLEEFGYEVDYIWVPKERMKELVPFAPNVPRVNVLGKLNGERKHPLLHLNGHMDVVPAGEGWSIAPYNAVVKDGKIYGRGASDMKSGIAAQIYAVEAIRRAGFHVIGSVEQSGVVDEETTGTENAGMYYLVEKGYINKDKTDYCVITEPLDPDRICIGHRGALWWKLTVKGVQAHGAMPYLGMNAAIELAKFISLLEYEYIPILKERVTEQPVAPSSARKASLSLGIIKGGTKINTVPEKAQAYFDRRVNPEENLDDARKEFIGYLNAYKEINPRFKYKIDEIYAAEPTLVPRNQDITKIFEETIKTVYRKSPAYVLSPGTDDQRFVVHNAGIKSCIVYGPGRLKLAHTADEYITIEDLLNGVKVLALSTVKLLGIRD